MTALKEISPRVPGDILLAEAIFVNNRRIRRDKRLTPFQLVTGQQSTLRPIKDTGEHTHHSLNMLKHLGVQVPDNQGGDLQEVTIQYQHMPSSPVARLVGNGVSPGNQDKNLGVELGRATKICKTILS